MQKLELQLPLEGLRDVAFVQPNRGRFYLATKRFADIVVSSVALIILSPIFLLVALAIKIEDPKGKVIYSQLRAGKDGVPFRMYKFRSMYSNADVIKGLLMEQNEMDGPVFKMRNDPRVTKVGRFIRRFSIDELPQFANTWIGDLSLVGPRPLPIKEAEGCNTLQRQRELVKPGLTCTWQISGRNNISFERWMEMDIDYIAKQSLWLDFTIMAKTIPAVFMSKGAS